MALDKTFSLSELVFTSANLEQCLSPLFPQRDHISKHSEALGVLYKSNELPTHKAS